MTGALGIFRALGHRRRGAARIRMDLNEDPLRLRLPRYRLMNLGHWDIRNLQEIGHDLFEVSIAGRINGQSNVDIIQSIHFVCFQDKVG